MGMERKWESELYWNKKGMAMSLDCEWVLIWKWNRNGSEMGMEMGWDWNENEQIGNRIEMGVECE